MYIFLLKIAEVKGAITLCINKVMHKVMQNKKISPDQLYIVSKKMTANNNSF